MPEYVYQTDLRPITTGFDPETNAPIIAEEDFFIVGYWEPEDLTMQNEPDFVPGPRWVAKQEFDTAEEAVDYINELNNPLI